MTPRAIRHFIIGFCCLNLVLSAPFFIMGAWPVVGFMGLDVLALYIAFKINFRSADAYETVEVTALEQDIDEEFGMERVALVSRGQSVEVGAFLGPEQKAALARDLARALADARRGPRFEQD